MCHQTVGLVAGALERRGIATTTITTLREITVKVRPPRALFVQAPLGYPVGRPNDVPVQTRIVRSALSLLESNGPFPLFVTFPESV